MPVRTAAMPSLGLTGSESTITASTVPMTGAVEK